MARGDDYVLDPADNPWGAIQQMYDHTVESGAMDALVLADEKGLPVACAGGDVDATTLSACCPFLAEGTADSRILDNLKGVRKYGLEAVQVEDRDFYLMAVYPSKARTSQALGRLAEGTSDILNRRS